MVEVYSGGNGVGDDNGGGDDDIPCNDKMGCLYLSPVECVAM